MIRQTNYNLHLPSFHLPQRHFVLKYSEFNALLNFHHKIQENILNKLAVLAMSLLLFFGTMLWYLANHSLDEFVASQVVLQGEYYTGKKVTIEQVSFNLDSGRGQLSQLNLLENDKSNDPIVTIKNAAITLSNHDTTSLLVKVDNIIIDEVTVFLNDKNANNIKSLDKYIKQQLISIIPEKKPDVILPNGVIKKKREKAESKIIISSIIINQLNIQISNKLNPENIEIITRKNITLSPIGNDHGLVANQLGAELLRQVFSYVISISSL